jgi:hypothetical protein
VRGVDVDDTVLFGVAVGVELTDEVGNISPAPGAALTGVSCGADPDISLLEAADPTSDGD